MRPRLKAAENRSGRARQGAGALASMRPRLKAAENGEGECDLGRDLGGFNEAAA